MDRGSFLCPCDCDSQTKILNRIFLYGHECWSLASWVR